jgi:hypothetical protein
MLFSRTNLSPAEADMLPKGKCLYQGTPLVVPTGVVVVLGLSPCALPAAAKAVL